jgi:uncharacterized cupin superfamily protein
MNLLHPAWDAQVPTDGGQLRAVRLGQHAGARRLAANLYELEGEAAVSPLHFHHANEELLFVLSGTPTLRTGEDRERTLAEGDVVAFPAGPGGVHQVVNRAAEPARVLICSTSVLPDVAEQTEVEQVAVVTQDGLRLFAASAAIGAR